MKDVARIAGTSTSTVSHVINNNRYVSPAVREKVLTAIAELNYAPSALARSLKIKETRTIGMLLTTSNNPFFSEVVRGVEHSCYQRGYSLILCNTEGSAERMLSSLEVLLQKRVDGLLLMYSESHPIPEDLFRCYPVLPIVMMDWAPFSRACDTIQDNSLMGGKMATQYLLRKGYRQIACITGPKNNTQACRRLKGYRQAMSGGGITLRADYEVEGNFQFSGGFVAMQQLLSLKQPPKAVFCSNDAMAVGVYLALHQAGLEVGKDVAVVGYDDIELAAFLTPPLTTIHQPKEVLGELAIETLLRRIEDITLEPEVLALTPRLIERQSVI